MEHLWVWNIPSLPLLPGPLWPEVVIPVMGKIFDSNVRKNTLKKLLHKKVNMNVQSTIFPNLLAPAHPPKKTLDKLTCSKKSINQLSKFNSFKSKSNIYHRPPLNNGIWQSFQPLSNCLAFCFCQWALNSICHNQWYRNISLINFMSNNRNYFRS